jgi:hypothetical protein
VSVAVVEGKPVTVVCDAAFSRCKTVSP